MTIIDWINQLLVHKKHWDEYTEDEDIKATYNWWHEGLPKGIKRGYFWDRIED